MVWCFLLLGKSFASLDIDTSLTILIPNYSIIYTPPYVTWGYTTSPLFVSITGDGIRTNETGIRENGIYTFEFYRGTGPFTTGAEYSSGNTRSLIKVTQTIDRIDDIPPTFAGVTEWATYDAWVTITFSDNLPGVTATLNGNPFVNGTTINTNGTYQLIVTDAAGNRTGATFIIYLSDTPPAPPGWDGWGGSSLGRWILTQPFCLTRTCYSTYYDSICGPCTPDDTAPSLPSARDGYHYATPDFPIIPPTIDYPQEWISAYQRAHRLGMISANNIYDANLEGVLYRKIAAKLASEFAIKALWLRPDTTRVCEFDDIENEIDELQYYIQLSCQLGIMGLDYYGNPDTIFNPNHFVTRDQFVTILSRMLFRWEYNLYPEEYSFFDKARNFVVHTIRNVAKATRLNIDIYSPLDRYSKHMEAIKKLWVITNHNPTIKEFRIYVILIMYRLDQIGHEEVQRLIK